jgi:regulator of cell morphogenesis and NO signaling
MMPVSESSTVRDLAANSLAAVKIFEKLGIDYCCGGKRPLAEVCWEKGYDPDTVRNELEAAIARSQTAERDWNTAPLAELINHIVSTHHEYLRRELGPLEARLEKVYRVYNERYGPTLTGLPEVYSALRSELELHIQKEEMILFPAIIGESPFVSSPIRVMEAEHDSAGQALTRIREITNDFAVPDYACVTFRALMSGLAELEQDLHRHIHLENNILFPRAEKA